MSLAKKVVLITGGSSGIGKAIGIHLTKKGYTVYGTTRNVSKYPDFTHFPLLELDVTKAGTIKKAVQELLSKEDGIDVLVNNAGVGITGPVEEIPEQEISSHFETNYFGAIKVMKGVLPQMRKQQSGLIINVTSIAGYMGLPFRGVYSASKAALEVTTEAMRMETKAFGIKITNLAPGDFATNIAGGRYHAPVIKGSDYQKNYQLSLDLMDAHVDEGGDPKAVGIMVEKIILTPNPRIHYKVGAFMQKFSVFLKRILPDKTYEKLLLNHYKL
ncbi:SDR family oxidoreductase [Aquimarina agarilytica]|uniref:SDR family oxidoreductase n=1 Tax=Aquimarina agarilytica TaxID=1087449 RepID=UPI0002F9959A|nr:SDR family oxidoreductase [Aquimarina agarilytica]